MKTAILLSFLVMSSSSTSWTPSRRHLYFCATTEQCSLCLGPLGHGTNSFQCLGPLNSFRSPGNRIMNTVMETAGAGRGPDGEVEQDGSPHLPPLHARLASLPCH